MTIKDYIINSFSAPIDEDIVAAAMAKRNIPDSVMMAEIGTNNPVTGKIYAPLGVDELLIADVIYTFLRTPTNTATVEKAGDFSISYGGYSINKDDKRQLKQMADSLYRRWKEAAPYTCPINYK